VVRPEPRQLGDQLDLVALGRRGLAPGDLGDLRRRHQVDGQRHPRGRVRRQRRGRRDHRAMLKADQEPLAVGHHTELPGQAAQPERREGPPPRSICDPSTRQLGHVTCLFATAGARRSRSRPH
jgi:hypothetical protein